MQVSPPAEYKEMLHPPQSAASLRQQIGQLTLDQQRGPFRCLIDQERRVLLQTGRSVQQLELSLRPFRQDEEVAAYGLPTLVRSVFRATAEPLHRYKHAGQRVVGDHAASSIFDGSG